VLLYHRFIHSIILGKHKSEVTKYDFNRTYLNEKRILRKIAALRQIYTGGLNKSVLRTLEENNSLQLDDILEPILTSYFYLHSENFGEELIDFMHNSLKEYLLAEYYIESLLIEKNIQSKYKNSKQRDYSVPRWLNAVVIRKRCCCREICPTR
jgi:hypothetical protein